MAGSSRNRRRSPSVISLLATPASSVSTFRAIIKASGDGLDVDNASLRRVASRWFPLACVDGPARDEDPVALDGPACVDGPARDDDAVALDGPACVDGPARDDDPDDGLRRADDQP